MYSVAALHMACILIIVRYMAAPLGRYMQPAREGMCSASWRCQKLFFLKMYKTYVRVPGMRKPMHSRLIKEGRVVRLWHGTKKVMDTMSIRAALALQSNAAVAAGLLASAREELPKSDPSESLLPTTQVLPGGRKRVFTTRRHRKVAAAAKKKFAKVTKPARKETNFKYKWTAEV